ncbi:MAG: nucleotidyltransferase domain-containing protein [Chloroflexota bacterium]|nr:nucleotidyltransferase domain-containing protein [Chloroflexota bacterium]
MICLFTENRARIAELYRIQNVTRLEVFGSAATVAFDPAASDIDMIVDLGPYSPDIADRYLDLAYGLEEILGRSVDLITSRSIRNPYFRSVVDRQRETIYENGNREAAA